MALPVKNIKITQHELGMVTHNCSPSSQEVKVDDLEVKVLQHKEFMDNLDYVRPSLKI